MNGEEEILSGVSSFELTKNTKGYYWKIKIYTNDLEEMKEKTEKLNNWAIEKYGGSENV